LGIESPVTGFGELAAADTHALADRAQHFAVAVQLQELAVLARRHPGIALVVEIEGADQILHLQSLHEAPVGGIDDNAILLAIADPDIAILWIDRQAMGGIELALADFIAEPLADKFSVLGQMKDAG